MFTVKVILKLEEDKNTARSANDTLPTRKADDLNKYIYLYIYMGLYRNSFKITNP